MIDLTPLEVRKKKGDFRRGLRGYEPAQVDDFLDVVADRLEALVRENMALTERVGRIDQQIADYRDREKALTEALVTAQQMREEMRAQTAREADTERRRALEDAERIRAEATASVEREEEKLRGLKARQAQFLGRYQSFLRSELDEVSVMANSLGLAIGPAQAAPQTPAWATAPASPSSHPPPDTPPPPTSFAPAPSPPAPAPPPAAPSTPAPAAPPAPTAAAAFAPALAPIESPAPEPPAPAPVPPTPATPAPVAPPPQDRPLRAAGKSVEDDLY
jgi:DivIVA domain-containing protein